MKEIYDWVPWFRELAQNIAMGDKDDLNQKAEAVNWGENLARLQTGDKGIDPFSFFYFLASKAATNQLKTVYESVSQIFAVRSPLPDPSVDEYYIFPTPEARYSVFCEMSDAGHELLWRLFNDAVKDEPTIGPTDFEDALKLNGVGVTRLTQTLFLINPEFFQPVDNITDDLSKALGLPVPSAIEADIRKEGGYEKYRAIVGKLMEAFPGCQPYEINMFLYMQRSRKIVVSDNFYQISTNVMNDGEDYWDDFAENNRVYTGGGQYNRLTEPNSGDVVLVRRGIMTGKAIGVVYKSDYREYGEWRKKLKIHVLWLNKLETQLNGQTEQVGFNRAGPKTRGAFEQTRNYRSSFDMIEKLKGISPVNESEAELGDPQSGADNMKSPHPLNRILFGPPGTSKTWHTLNHALAIIDGKENVDSLVKESKEDRDAKMRQFNELKANGQIQMATFHQNYNYEDFIEGIRPVLSDDMDKVGKVEYELSRGVFREISDRASENRWRSAETADESSDIDDLLEAFAEWIDERLDSNEQINLNLNDRKEGTKKIIKVIWSGDDTFKSVLAGTGGYGRYITRDVIKKYYRAFCNGEIKSKEDIKPTRNSKKPLHANARYYFALFKKIKEFQDNEWRPGEPVTVQKQNYVMIIDEINRGNIAKIFGELITLIEESKRIGGHDETTATLPYSNEEFGVPDNLFIIGTMNTADRSVALLDTALRRRFDFIEMMPNPVFVSDDVEGVNCRQLLAKMNKRIRFLLDREHQIGHTYLMDIDDLESLEAAFKNRIIPLLQEYFYDNWEKIDLILNRNGFIHKTRIESDLFKDSDLIDDQSEIHEILSFDDGEWKNPKSYIDIYENGKQNDAGKG